jgi:hypothetical protein
VGEVVSPKSTLKHVFGRGKDSQVPRHISLEVLVQGYRLDWSRMQKELQGVRISAVDRFVDSNVEYNRKGGRTRVTEERRDPNGSQNTSHFENEPWERKPWTRFEKVVFRLQQRLYKASRDRSYRRNPCSPCEPRSLG